MRGVQRFRDAGEVSRWVVEQGGAPSVAAGHRGPTSAAPSLGGDVDRVFDLASVTKPMTAVAFARSGLDRRAPLAHYLPELAGTRAADAPLELFLAHRAGMEAHVALFEPLLRDEPFDADEALRAAADAVRPELRGAPLPREGHPPIYSDMGYALAGAALARALGVVDAGAAIEQLVVAPLAAERRADLPWALGTARALGAVDYVPTEIVPFRGGEVRGVVHDENAWALTADGGSGHAGMFGTVAAVLDFGKAVLDGLRGDGPLAGFDLEWLVRERPGGTLRAGFDGKSASGSSVGAVMGPRTFGHLGFTGTSLWMDPETGVTVSLLTNRVHPTRENGRLRELRPAAHDALAHLAHPQTPVK